MRFKLDENLHPEVAAFLLARGHDAVTIWDEGLRGRPDPDIAAICQTERRALMTLDLDFADIRAYPPDLYPGLIVLRLHDHSRRWVLAVLQRLLPTLEHQRVEGNLLIVEESGIRLHEGDVVEEK